MLRSSRFNQFHLQRAYRCASTSSTSTGKDHYSTLGIPRTANAKEIKSAFYELSKQYHPDRNPDDKANASIKFQDVLNAYEILSNTEKRKEYDRQFTVRRYPGQTSARYQSTMKEKRYTDLDLDFKDLEHFQRMARRRRSSQAFTYESAEEFLKQGDRYRSTLAAEREREERRIREELEEKRRQARYKTPTFEELLQHERRRKTEAFKKQMGSAALVSFIIVVFVTLFSGNQPR